MVTSPAAAVDFEALVQEGRGPVTRYLLARTGSTAEASELVQETFVRAYCALSRGDAPRHPLAWLLAIARNVYLESVRGERYRRQLAERMSRLMGGIDWHSPWHEEVEHRIIVGSAVDSLPDDLREPVLLHYFAGLSLSEVARHLEITASAAKSRLWRARRALRGELEVLVGETKQVTFTLPADLAGRAKSLAEQPPYYRDMSANLQAGGTHDFTAPTGAPLYSGEWLSLEDMHLAIRRLHALRVAGPRPLAPRLGFTPRTEVRYHPEPIAMWRFLRSAAVGHEAEQESEEGHLEVSDGWVLGTDPKAPQLLRDFREAGLRHVWFEFAGLRGTHDDLCRRPGAFDAIVTAMTRCREAGIATGANILISTHSAPEAPELARLIISFGGETMVPAHLIFYSPLRPEYEEIRPEPEDLADLRPGEKWVQWGGANWGGFWSEFHADPESFTEGALTRAALAHPEAQQPVAPSVRALSLYVAADFTLSVFEHFSVGLRLGNLRTDPVELLYQKLVNLRQAPARLSDAELATRYGDTRSRKVHRDRASVRAKWLAAWRDEHGVEWLPEEAY